MRTINRHNTTHVMHNTIYKTLGIFLFFFGLLTIGEGQLAGQDIYDYTDLSKRKSQSNHKGAAMDGNSYEIIESNSGLVNLYEFESQNLAETIVSTINTNEGITNFKVLGCDFAPLLAFAKDDQFDKNFQMASNQIGLANDNFIFIAKHFGVDGQVKYNVKFQIKGAGAISSLNELDKERIKIKVLNAIKEKAGTDNYS